MGFNSGFKGLTCVVGSKHSGQPAFQEHVSATSSF